MAKRGATEQITKDTWERADERDSRDRSEEPAEDAPPQILAKRKILKPKSRVSNASSMASAPATPSLFNLGQSAGPAAASSSLFGRPQATPSKNPFGQSISTPSAPAIGFGTTPSQKPSAGSLFGTPAQSNSTSNLFGNISTTPSTNPQSTGSLFGLPNNQASPAPKPSTPLFGGPPAFASSTPKPDSNLFKPSTQTPNGNIKPAAPSNSLFGFPPAKSQDGPSSNNQAPPEIAKPSTTPTATPLKQNPFALFGNPSPSISSKPDPVDSAGSITAGPATGPSIAAEPPASKKPDAQNTTLFSGPKPSTNNIYPSLPSSNNIFKPNTPSVGSKPTATPIFGTAPQPPSKPSAGPSTTGTDATKIDPNSLEPPSASSLTKEQMPTFNWLYQIRSLNYQFLEQTRQAISEDPYSDLSTWAEFYKQQVSSFAALRLSQKDQVENGMNIDRSMTDAPKPEATASSKTPLFPFGSSTPSSNISYPQLPNSSNEPISKPAPNNQPPLFGKLSSDQNSATPPSQPASIFNSTSAASGLFGSKPSAPAETKPTPFAFGSGSQTPNSIFDSAPTSKPAAANLFSWNSKPSSAVPSNASSPGSVLAGGTAGMKDSSAGGWSNPFTSENPMFLTNNDEDEDEDEDENEEGAADEVDAENPSQEDEENESSEPASASSKQTSLFGQPSNVLKDSAAQSTPPNSLFGRVGTAPSAPFGQASTPKTGAVGLFGSTSAAQEGKTWTPDKGIFFGERTDNKNGATPSTNSSTSLFGSQPSANVSTPPTSIFGNAAAGAPSFNFSVSSNGKSIFSNPPSKPATPPVLFGGQTGGGLVPPPSLFGGASPAPSDISTPGDTSNKEGGEDENEPSDEAGHEGNVKDLSGRGPGEEDEDEIFEARSSIYNLNKGAYVKIGIGRLRVLKNRNTLKSRIVVKVETGKVLMNVGLRKEIDYTKVSPSEADGKVVKVIEFLSGSGSRVWVMKVGTVELAQKLRKTLEENK
ncbi:hypothetical protein ABW19_dt0210245 [Dactylella cylindrospora]|nr:hypothetical protein ABW19_dt0210245 [Dactylella cylindrospora]